MATKIRMVSDWKTRKTGEVWSASDSQAKQLVDAEIAVAFVDDLPTELEQTVASVKEITGQTATAQPEASATNLATEVATPSTPTEEVADADEQPLPQRYNRRCHTK
jgi:hypothetical protein